MSDWQVTKLCHLLVEISHLVDLIHQQATLGLWEAVMLGGFVSASDPDFSLGQSQGLHWQDSAMKSLACLLAAGKKP